MSKLKLNRDELIIDITRLAIVISETKDFSIQTEMASYVGKFCVTLHFKDGESDPIRLLDLWHYFLYPMDDKAWHERHFPLDFKTINKELQKCKQTLTDLLIGKINYLDLTKIN